ncbi:hypothetical protein [Klebsiella michiganensis]
MARTSIRIGRHILDFVPVVFLVLTAVLTSQFQKSMDTSDQAMQLVNTLNKQRTAAEMRAMHAEREAAKSGNSSFNVFVIQPEKRNASSPAYVDMNKPL